MGPKMYLAIIVILFTIVLKMSLLVGNFLSDFNLSFVFLVNKKLILAELHSNLLLKVQVSLFLKQKHNGEVSITNGKQQYTTRKLRKKKHLVVRSIKTLGLTDWWLGKFEERNIGKVEAKSKSKIGSSNNLIHPRLFHTSLYSFFVFASILLV